MLSREWSPVRNITDALVRNQQQAVTPNAIGNQETFSAKSNSWAL